jgi:hypothetical protein
MKEFNLEAAKNGDPLITRDGRRARIITFDAKGNYPIVALIEYSDSESSASFDYQGRYLKNKESSLDLFIDKAAHVGFVNIYRNEVNITAGRVFDTFDSAKEHGQIKEGYIATVRICWEE